MALTELEVQLLESLSNARESSSVHLESLSFTAPAVLSEVAAIGIDTNILKALRREPPFAEQLLLTLQDSGVAVIAPGQCVIEFWNNHQIFASTDWNEFKADFQRLTNRLQKAGLVRHFDEAVGTISALVDQMSRDLQEEKSPEFLSRSRDIVQLVLGVASKPMVSRPRFSALAEIRQASKVPPGFADDRQKLYPYGDFFVWCDFLLGAMSVKVTSDRQKFVWVTDDSKPDWKTGGEAHPALVEEFKWVRDSQLSIVGYSWLKEMVRASEAPVSADDPASGGSDL